MTVWKKITLALLFIIIFHAGVSCKKSDSESESYYPLKEGLNWTYQVSSGETIDDSDENAILTISNLEKKYLKLEKVTPQQITYKGKSDLKFIIQNEEGIFEFGKQLYGMGMPEINDPKLFYLKTPVQIGGSWKEIHATQCLPEKMMVPVTVTIESMDETVTVPAGTYQNCLKLIKKGQFTKNLGEFLGVSNVAVEKAEWYVKGVGLIKSEILERSNQVMYGNRLIVQELKAFRG
ncbi:MAG: hypothetical protein HF978_10050 [Desulfobacteraceae bacterium]|nr:hypothetical protein [Desulfobacteraceae bacterium]MBC2755878.1 hypothetical protein [Desulfobacteraceae bacterium]MBC2763955.1 hypothetical protein [ANME-2 cluster archaeon]